MKTKQEFEALHMDELNKFSMSFADKIVIAKELALKDSKIQFYERIIDRDHARSGAMGLEDVIETINIHRGAT